MTLLRELGNGAGFLKAGFLGFPKSGKTWTAVLLAAGTRKLFSLDGPIAIFDTEGGADYVADLVKRETGKMPVGMKSRSFDDLMKIGKECEESGVSVLVVDSITHVWRELCDAYMRRMNEALEAQNKSKKTRMDIQDIMKVKALWSAWPDFYLNSRLHIVICGRAGFEWGMEENEETGKKELTKTGIKMKVESEFGFEPSLLIQMERTQPDDGKTKLVHRATILGDRFGVIDSRECDNPGFDFFKPHVEKLRGTHSPVDVSVKSEPAVDLDGNSEWQREKRERTILCEEIQGEIVKAWPGQTAEEKKAKAEIIDAAFGTRSWTRVETLESKKLREGLDYIRSVITKDAKKEPVPA